MAEPDLELIRRAIDDIKSFALTASYTDHLDLAVKYFIDNPNTHDHWDILNPDVKMLYTKLAEGAIYEITTGKEIQ